MANIDSGRNVIRYQSCKAYEGKGDAKVLTQDYKAALEAYENGLAFELHASGILGYGPMLQICGAIALWHTYCGVFENQGLLKKALLEMPFAMEDLIIVTSSEEEGDGSLQYWGAKVYEMANIDDGEKIIGYQSNRAYEGKGDAKVFMGDFKGALESYEDGLAIEFYSSIVWYKPKT
ncbi:unnamed protein product [Calypogeia fissa]